MLILAFILCWSDMADLKPAHVHIGPAPEQVPVFRMIVDQIKLTEHVDGKQYLVNPPTGEIVAMPMSDDNCWDLSLSEDSVLVCSPEREELDPIWACDLFKWAFYKDGNGEELFYNHTESLRLPRKEYKMRHDACVVGVPVAGAVGGGFFACYRFLKPVVGARWWWSLHTLAAHTLCPSRRGSSKRSKTAWLAVQKRWKSWDNACLASCLPRLRRAAEHNISGVSGGILPDSEERLLPVPTATTSGIIVILARLSFNSTAQGGCHDELARSCALALLNGFIRRAAPVAITLAFGPLEVDDYGLWTGGCFKTTLEVDDKQVADIIALKSKIEMLKLRRFESVLELPDHCPVIRVLEAFHEIGKGALPMTQQLSWALGACLESALELELLSLRAGSAPENKFSVAFETSGVSNQERERQCMAYWRRGLAAAAGQKFFSWGCDASRVGFKGRTVTLVALTDNRAFWCPPQASDSRVSMAIAPASPRKYGFKFVFVDF